MIDILTAVATVAGYLAAILVPAFGVAIGSAAIADYILTLRRSK